MREENDQFRKCEMNCVFYNLNTQFKVSNHTPDVYSNIEWILFCSTNILLLNLLGLLLLLGVGGFRIQIAGNALFETFGFKIERFYFVTC